MKNESGRSLVEMMGTLAIMGILSMAGLWMYNAGMDHWRASDLITEAQKRAVIAAGQINMQGRTNPTLAEFSNNTFAGGTFATEVVTAGLYQQFGIKVEGVRKRICQNILKSIGDSTFLRRLSPVDSPRESFSDCTEDNDFLMIYNNNMSDSKGDTAYTCEKDSDCSVCGTCNTETHACENDCEVPTPTGGCDFDNECNQENKCLFCNTTTRLCEDGCKRKEYLESTGEQYIDTQIVPSSTLTTEMDFAITDDFIFENSSMLFGSFANSFTHYSVAIPSNTRIRVPRAQQFQNVIVPAIGTTRHIISYTPGHILLDGTQVSTYAGNIGSVAPTVRIFGRNSNAADEQKITKGIRCYNVKIQSGSTLMLNLVPVHAPFKESNKQNCMFDQKSKELFCNVATGNDFITN